MATTTFNGPVRSEGGFQMATKNNTTGAVTTRMSSGMPDLTGSLIESRATNEVTFDTSAASEGQIVFTPADAATNLLTTGGKIAFMCFEDGVWHIATEFTGAAAAVTGAIAFAA